MLILLVLSWGTLLKMGISFLGSLISLSEERSSRITDRYFRKLFLFLFSFSWWMISLVNSNYTRGYLQLGSGLSFRKVHELKSFQIKIGDSVQIIVCVNFGLCGGILTCEYDKRERKSEEPFGCFK